jgi:hypothetical protein
LLAASHAAAQGKPARAHAMRLVFVLLYAINLAGDLGAFYTFTTADADKRAIAWQTGQNTVEHLDEMKTERDNLRKQLERDSLNLPVEALKAKRDGAIAQRDAGGVSAQTQTWRAQRVAQLDAALEIATRAEELDGQIDGARSATVGRARSAEHPQIEGLTKVLGWMGFAYAPEDVRLALAVLMAVVIRCCLAIGFWVALPEDDSEGEGGGWKLELPRFPFGRPAAVQGATPQPSPAQAQQAQAKVLLEPLPHQAICPAGEACPASTTVGLPAKTQPKTNIISLADRRASKQSLFDTINELEDEFGRED